MKNLFAISLACIASFIFFSCKQNVKKSDTCLRTLEKIDLNSFLNAEDEALHFDEILDTMQFIFLETTDDCLVDIIFNIIVTDNRVFIHDNYLGGGFIIFDRNGKFIKRVPRGNGPGEINRIVNISYDKWRNEVIVVQNPHLQRYTIDGEYIGDYEVPFPMDNLVVLEDEYFFTKLKGHYCKTIEGWDDYSAILTDRNFNIKKMMIPYGTETHIPFSNRTHMQTDGEISIIAPANDTIFRFVNDTTFTSYLLDYSDTKMDKDDLSFEKLESSEIFGKSYIYNYIESSTHQFFLFTKDRYYPILYTETNKVAIL